MKALALAILSVLSLSAALGAEPEGKVLLADLSALTPQASDSVSITLDAPLLSLAARFLDSDDPQDAAVRELIGGLKGIYVKSFTFEKDFVYPADAGAAVRRQLLAPAWQQIVSVHSTRERSAVDIYICQVGSRTRGLAIIATEPRQFTVVNIVGSIDLEKLHKLEGRFGIPKLTPAQ